MSQGWIGVDLDGTLAEYHGWSGVNHIGKPIPKMVERVKAWLGQGITVKIFTARASDNDPNTVKAIKRWCLEHIGQELSVVYAKDFDMIELWDDRAVQVEKNTGQTIQEAMYSKLFSPYGAPKQFVWNRERQAYDEITDEPQHPDKSGQE